MTPRSDRHERTKRESRGALFAAIALFLAIAVTSSRAAAQDPDPWFGRDKALHFGASAAIAAGAYGGSALFIDARGYCLAIGGGVSLAVGAGKELADLAGFGSPSWRDFTSDILGTIAGLGVAWGLDLVFRGASSAHPLFEAPRTSPAR